jgi:hypothetical protein
MKVAPRFFSNFSAFVAIWSPWRQTIFARVRYLHRMTENETTKQNRESPMGTVMVRCPETGRDIATGIVTDRESFRSTPVFFARVYCPLCRTQHEWFAQEAWVCEPDPVSGPRQPAAA